MWVSQKRNKWFEWSERAFFFLGLGGVAMDGDMVQCSQRGVKALKHDSDQVRAACAQTTTLSR